MIECIKLAKWESNLKEYISIVDLGNMDLRVLARLSNWPGNACKLGEFTNMK